MAAQIMTGILDYYVIPLALFMGASTQGIGLLVAIPTLLASLSQFFAVRAVHVAGSRKNLMLRATAVQIAVILPIGLLSFLPFSVNVKLVLLVVAMSTFRVLGSVFGPAWGSLMSEYLPENRRGKYFGMRSRRVGLAGLFSVAFWGVTLQALGGISNRGAAFAVLFVAAALFRVVSYLYLSRLLDLPWSHSRESDFTFWMFIRRFRESNFVKYIAFISGITFATQMAAPFYSVLMLKNLGFNYVEYMAVHLASVAIGFVAFPIWGRHADVVGNARILKTVSILLPVIPVLWIFARNVYALVAVEMFAGFMLTGFTLCATNFIYDAVSPDKRVRCLGYFNLLNGTAAFLGTALGGFLAERLPAFMGNALYSLFLLSAAGRLLANLALSRHFREVRATARPTESSELFYSVVGLRPIVGRNGEEVSRPPSNDPAPFRWRAPRSRRSRERETAQPAGDRRG